MGLAVLREVEHEVSLPPAGERPHHSETELCAPCLGPAGLENAILERHDLKQCLGEAWTTSTAEWV